MVHTRSRLLYGQTMYNPLSRFVSEIPSSLVEKLDDTDAGAVRVTGYGSYGYGGTSGGFGRSVYGNGRGAEAPVTQKRTYYSESASRTPITQSRPTTSAERLTVGGASNTKKPAAKEVFAPGDRVKHLNFGVGEILSVKPMGADILYEIVFESVGTKKLMATYARLTKA